MADAPPESYRVLTTLYVDDETEQEEATNPEELQDKLQVRLYAVTEWLMDNKMVIEPSKSKLIVSMTKELRSRKWPDVDTNVVVLGHTLTPTPSEKLLGVIISQDLTWTKYLTKHDIYELQTLQRQSALLLLPRVEGPDNRPTD